MPKEITLKIRVPTKDEALEVVKKTIEQLEGMAKVEIVEVPEAKPKEAPKPPEEEKP